MFKKYNFTITFENTSDVMTRASNGVVFSGTTKAESLDEAKNNVEKVANKMYYDRFANSYDNGQTFVYGLLQKPKYMIDINLVQIMDTNNGHNDKLVDIINYIYTSCEYNDRLEEALRILYKRDYVELANYYSDECVWWKADELSFDEMVKLVGLEDLAHELLYHVCDDADLEMVILYVRPTIDGKGWEKYMFDYYKSLYL